MRCFHKLNSTLLVEWWLSWLLVTIKRRIINTGKMKRTKFLILFLFYTSVLLIKGKLREPDEFVMYDERIGNENSRCLWNKVCRYDLQFGILVCQLKCMNFSFRSLPIFCRKKPKFEYCKLFCSGRICRKLCHFSAGERCTV